MQSYKNAANSGVQKFNTGTDYIILEFEDEACYLYNYKKPGRHHVDAMIKLAQKGSGLNTYINRHVRNSYFEKLK